MERKIETFHEGDKVRFVGKEESEEYPWLYPPLGTEGVVLGGSIGIDVWVQWPEGTVIDRDGSCWLEAWLLEKVEG